MLTAQCPSSGAKQNVYSMHACASWIFIHATELKKCVHELRANGALIKLYTIVALSVDIASANDGNIVGICIHIVVVCLRICLTAFLGALWERNSLTLTNTHKTRISRNNNDAIVYDRAYCIRAEGNADENKRGVRRALVQRAALLLSYCCAIRTKPSPLSNMRRRISHHRVDVYNMERIPPAAAAAAHDDACMRGLRKLCTTTLSYLQAIVKTSD